MTPLRFAFAVHLHQPVGNFDHVFEDHLDGVYRPFLDAVRDHDCYPLTLHVSGPLIDWLEAHAPRFLDHIGACAAEGQIELLASGRYEPILAALPREDRIEQVAWMNELLRERFGVEARGLWLTERVWEPDLAADLGEAGIRYALLDDRHLLATGLARDELDRPYRTEADGRSLALLSIDERLRYLIPFRPVAEIAEFLETQASRGAGTLVLGDDGEKFGGWPDTRAWVYEEGWLREFLEALTSLRSSDTIELVTTDVGAAQPSGGLLYPASGSYREMEEWTLPTAAARAFAELRTSTAEASPFVRGGHWKGFFARYPESNRMHKAALQLSRLCRRRGDPPEARRAIARAQCNDAYWHGVFGGVYLPHLRNAVWRELARAESSLRRDEPLSADVLDFDLDGHDEIWIHSSVFSAVLSPTRGGSIQMLLRFGDGTNDCDVLTRRLEPYHAGDDETDHDAVETVERASAGTGTEPGIASVHDRHAVRPVPPALDVATLALFQERIVPGPLGSTPMSVGLYDLVEPPRLDAEAIHVELRRADGGGRKRYTFHRDGTIDVELEWENESDGSFATTLALAHEREVVAPNAEVSRERIVTLARSERGFEHIDQGELMTLSWPLATGAATVRLAHTPASAEI